MSRAADRPALSRVAIAMGPASGLVGVPGACSMLLGDDLSNGSTGAESDSGEEGGSSAGEDGGSSNANLDGSPLAGEAGTPMGTTYRDLVMADAPVAYYRLDETKLGTVKDETGRFPGAHRGAVTVGAPSLIPASERAATFGASSRIEIEGLDVRSTDPFTLELWMSPTTNTARWQTPSSSGRA